jgi:hypothetical protein
MYKQIPMFHITFTTLRILKRVGFEVLTAITMKSTILYNGTLCTPGEGSFCLHLQGQTVSQARNQQAAGGKHSSGCHLGLADS